MRGTVQARRTKKRYPARRADNIRPYDKTGAQHSGRIISAPTKSGNLVWGAVYVRPTKSGNPVWATVHVRPTKSGNSVWERCISAHEKRKSDTVGGTCPPDARCSASP